MEIKDDFYQKSQQSLNLEDSFTKDNNANLKNGDFLLELDTALQGGAVDADEKQVLESLRDSEKSVNPLD